MFKIPSTLLCPSSVVCLSLCHGSGQTRVAVYGSNFEGKHRPSICSGGICVLAYSERFGRGT